MKNLISKNFETKFRNLQKKKSLKFTGMVEEMFLLQSQKFLLFQKFVLLGLSFL